MEPLLAEKLREIAELDGALSFHRRELEDGKKKLSAVSAEVAREQKRLAEMDGRLAIKKKELSSKESKLKEEDKHISERRRQLAEMGGAKSAKYAEREVDIAARSLQALEEELLILMEEVDMLDKEAAAFRKKVEQSTSSLRDVETSFSDLKSRSESKISEIDGRRREILLQIDAQVVRLYDRILGKYPNGAIAKIKGENCEVCFRALPIQVLNQVKLGDQVHQCPGCNRILVPMESEAEPAEG